MATGLLSDDRFLLHDTGLGHPECPERMTWALERLRKEPWFAGLVPVRPEAATLEQVLTVHSREYLQRAEEACRQGERFLDSLDVSISTMSYEIALLACGGCLKLADFLMSGKIQNGYALLRPPGHHAEADQAMGFCIINNVAVLAKYLQKQYGMDKILILDWDVHHGNGTQHTFEEDPSVHYVSLHQYPFYPGTGHPWETGINRGDGATLNCPMSPGSGDADYQKAFREKILPQLHEFKPEAVIISSGFDAHARDPLANIELSTECFVWMTDRLMEIADRYSQGRILSVIEGGYDYDAMPECLAAHLGALKGPSGS